ncbi:gluconolactonase [Cesiribacter andamanensis]|uniref:Gluconolactonase n=1 Tax=Cesiribacter andamanensis AMV16 TaxID=1279009 RepID=M7NR96_9BACT|nr:gluconolactonase [Cesiribacter andamanensis]EMR04230.1 Gluconolactonase [Cesiribacter andamanensis AMV16]
MKASLSPYPLLLALLMVFGAACSPDEEQEDPLSGQAGANHSQKWASGELSIMRENLYPEGLEYDRHMKRFLLSSITQGSIGFVEEYGSYMEWINDPDIPSTIGLHIDLPRKRLLVAVSDLGLSKKSSETTAYMLAGLAAYDLRSGERLFFIRMDELLPGLPHFANDVTVDQRGNAYVTDSFTGVIYKVDVEGEASIFYQDAALNPAPDNFGLNGIEYDPRGYLLVSKLDENKLLRFPLNNPSAYTEIEVPVALNSPDGLTLTSNKELVVVNNAFGGEQGSVLRLRSRDGWKTTEVVGQFATGPVFPTTAALRPGGDVFVVYAYLHVLLSGGSQSRFQIAEAN